MALFKNTYKDRDGKMVRTDKWYNDFKDHNGIRRRLPLFKDKRVSEEADRNIGRLVALRQSRQSPDAALMSFIEGIPPALRDKLAEFDILSQQTHAAHAQLAVMTITPMKNNPDVITVTGGHLYDWQQGLVHKQREPRHIKQEVNKSAKIIRDCGFRFPTDIDARRVEHWLNDLHDRGSSACTINSHLTAFRSFCRWLVTEGRLQSNPLQGLTRLNERTDRRRIRRTLVLREISCLLQYTAQAPLHHGLTGAKRVLVYQIALEAGLRWNEIATLQRLDFDFTVSPATIKVRAQNSKHRSEDLLPLRQDLANNLRAYFTASPQLPTCKAFLNIWSDRGGEMLAQDMTAAGLETVNPADEVVDFHSLRHTFGTMLAKSGVHPKIAQDLMRHSSIELTMNRYTHTVLENRAEALVLCQEKKAG